MVSEKEELNLLDTMISYLNKLDDMPLSSKDTEEWKSLEKELMELYHKLVAINPANRYFGEEISQTFHPEYFAEEMTDKEWENFKKLSEELEEEKT